MQRNRQMVNVRFFHATPQAQAVDVYINDTLIHPNLSYKETTNYFPIMRGVYEIHLVDPMTGQRLLTQRMTINDNRYITIIAIAETNQVGLLSLPDKSIQEMPIPTVKEEMPVLGQFQLPSQKTEVMERAEMPATMVPVRFVHLSPNAPAVDVYLNDEPVYRDIIYKEATTYLEVVPQTYRLSIRSHQNLQELATTTLTIQPGVAQTVYITGLVGGSPRLEMVVLVDGEQ